VARNWFDTLWSAKRWARRTAKTHRFTREPIKIGVKA
jgi:hypothetical protein